MKPDSKSALFRILFICMLLTPLLGCADVALPSWFTGEPDQKQLNDQRPIMGAPSASDQPWPNLADVPARPTDFSSQAARKSEVETMKNDYDEATDLKAQIDATPAPVVLPLPVPAIIGADTKNEKGAP